MLNYNEEDIKRQIKDVLKYSQDFQTHDPQVNALYDKWYNNKSRFIERLGGKLIYEFPQTICFEMSEQDKNKNIEDFITNIDWVYSNINKINEICSFFEECKKDIYQNILRKDFVMDDGTVIKKGIKINKALKFFFLPEEKESLTNLQSDISRLIQKNKVKGKLCISVHPLDFLSSSENTCNWRTCHSLDGEYRAGNLSYMVDKATLICYLKSEEDVVLPNFPPSIKWNNKKWRVLIHVSNDNKLIFAGRPYPFFSKQALDYVKNILISHMYNTDWTNWSNKQIKSFKFFEGESNSELELYSGYIPIEWELKSIREIIKTKANYKNYNDIFYSHSYEPYYSYNKGHYNTSLIETIIEIGNDIPCLCCEEKFVGLTDIFRCIECEEKYGVEESRDFFNCDFCGKRTFFKKIQYYENKIICDDCIKKENFYQCSVCGAVLDNKDKVKYINKEAYCEYCYNRRKNRHNG